MTENEYSHLVFMYHHTGYDEIMPFEEFINRYGEAILNKMRGDDEHDQAL